MLITKRNYLVITALMFCILLPACGPSPEEQSATAAVLTASAASPTPLPTSTPRPTFTPTLTPTPTPIPEPDAKAMINLEELNLPEGYRSLNPLEMGLGEGDWIMAAQMEDGTQIDYYIYF